jgi:arylsulfatase A-like enzyme
MLPLLADDVVAPNHASAAEDVPPNVLIVLTDDHRADWVAASPLRTTNTGQPFMPYTESLMLNQGITFKNGFVTNPVCCPSRASILTGTYSHTNRVWTNQGPHGGFGAFSDRSTLATWLNRIGYRTGYFGKYLNGYASAPAYVPPGWDRWFVHVRPGYFDYSFSDDGTVIESDGTWAGTVIADRVVEFIQTSPEPFFAFVSPFVPHKDRGEGGLPVPNSGDELLFEDEGPYRVPGYNERNVDDKPKWIRRLRNGRRWPARVRDNQDEFRLLQYRALFGWDREFASIVGALEALGRLENTLIVFLSDNGYQWGEHRLSGKSKPYDASVRVPFALRYDAHPLLSKLRGATRSEIALNIDIAPTIAKLAGARVPRWVEGVSLVGVLKGAVKRRRFAVEHYIGGRAPAFCSVRTRRQVFVRYATGEEEFYDYRHDPWELRNAASDRDAARKVTKLRAIAKSACAPAPPGFSW